MIVAFGLSIRASGTCRFALVIMMCTGLSKHVLTHRRVIQRLIKIKRLFGHTTLLTNIRETKLIGNKLGIGNKLYVYDMPELLFFHETRMTTQ